MINSEIFYFDVDGTLLDNDTHSVSQFTIEALTQLKKNGYLVALCTGRNATGIKEAGVDSIIDWDGYVLSNGSLVLDRNFDIIHEVYFSIEMMKQFVVANNGPLLCEGNYNFITGTPNKRLIDAFNLFKIPNLYPVEKYTDQRVHNMISYSHDKISKDDFERYLSDKVLVEDLLGNLEIIPSGSGKDKGIHKLNQHLGVSKYAGFGDGDNDVEFLKKADFGVAMGNGCERTKKVADFITKSVNEDGIFYALKRFEII